MTKFCTVLLAFFCSANLIAQNASLSGIIKDAVSEEGLFTATVQSGTTGTTADLEGRYGLELPAGDHIIEFNYVGYEVKSVAIKLKAGENKTLDVSLTEEATLLNTATVTSGKFEKPLSEVTVSMEILKPALLERTNSTSIKGVLDKVPGLSFVGDQANIRGGSGFSYGAGSRVLLLIDDIPFLQADSGVPQWSDVPFENLEQIEVIKGAASALYGSSALNGVVNARTAYAKSKPQTKISPYYNYTLNPSRKETAWWGDDHPYQVGASVSHKRKIGKLDMIVGGFYSDNKSHNRYADGKRGRVNTNFRYRFTDRFNISMNANLIKTKGSSWFYWAEDPSEDLLNLREPSESTRSESESTRFNIDPSVTYFDNHDNKHVLKGRFYNTGNSNTNVAAGDQSNTARLYYGEYQFQKNFKGMNMVATTGLVLTHSNVKAPLYGNHDFNSNNYAAYLQLDKKIGDKLNLSSGVRAERNEIIRPEILEYPDINLIDTLLGGKITETKPVFRLGANYKAADFTFLRASWGQGYRFPTIAEKFISTSFGGTNINPNLDLKSETGWTAEIGIKQGYKISNLNGFIDVAFFWSEYNDMMEFNVVDGNLLGAFKSQNIGDTEIRGMDISFVGTGDLFGIKTDFLAGYTYLNPKFKKFDREAESGTEAWNNAINSSVCNGINDGGTFENCQNILKYRSKHSVKMDIQMTRKKLSIGFGAIYNSKMVNIDNVLELLIAAGSIGEWRRQNNHGNLILSARASYQITDFWKIAVIGKNISNQEYVSRPGQLEAPANVAVRMDFDF
ncbi:MAG: outer membrane receptor protein involved in Fe transport [Paraglaciecola sp.]|jgi:outer membrane receptor protein involved in Fe transport